MAKLQFTVNFSISPAPLSESATSGDVSGQVGQPLSVSNLDVVSGGEPPYSVALDPSSPNPLPPGVSASIDGSGNLVVSGTPSAAGSGAVVLSIADQQG